MSQVKDVFLDKCEILNQLSKDLKRPAELGLSPMARNRVVEHRVAVSALGYLGCAQIHQVS